MLSECLQHLEIKLNFFCDIFFSIVAVPIERMDSFTVDQNKYSSDACLVTSLPHMTDSLSGYRKTARPEVDIKCVFIWGLPQRFSGQHSVPPSQGEWVWSLVGELKILHVERCRCSQKEKRYINIHRF